MKLVYRITEGASSAEEFKPLCYGIAAYSNADDPTSMIASVCNITSERIRLSELVDRCNRLRLSPIHLMDVIEDFLFD
ncbi:MAG: hypothetical protein IJX80_07945 [Clostridia bacterium]|nr:hypothetical protein [Clostridia bacterium]